MNNVQEVLMTLSLELKSARLTAKIFYMRNKIPRYAIQWVSVLVNNKMWVD